MEYKHNPPSLEELRKLRKKMLSTAESNKEKKGFFSSKQSNGGGEDRKILEELSRYEADIIIAHLENQNELLLEIMRKLERL
ncbi:MAG: hypothetical protein Q8O98_02005 [bacterium]|nr:hypothetical protein [bacterium]